LTRLAPSLWAALALLVWSVVALVAGTDSAPPPSILIVLVLAMALTAASNRRMRTTGRLLLAFLAFVYVVAEVAAGASWLTVLGIALAAAVALLAVVELVRS
jgi:hypothetical protein